ncbi:MAG: Hpt domain-containing protein [bacterium]|nr:Hpt domain-containing protein [bacterium]
MKKWLSEQVGDDEFLLQTLYDDYRGTLAKQLAQARSDMAASDFAALDRTAHAMKGATLTVGDEEMLQAVLALRDAAKASDLAGAISASVLLETLIDLL